MELTRKVAKSDKMASEEDLCRQHRHCRAAVLEGGGVVAFERGVSRLFEIDEREAVELPPEMPRSKKTA